MKTVRTVNGVSRIEDAPGSQQYNDALVSILIAHRDTLIKRMLGNLEVYMDYKFHIKPPREKMNVIRDRLANMKGYNVSSAYHDAVLKEIGTRDHVYIGTGQFYEEIDKEIEWLLK